MNAHAFPNLHTQKLPKGLTTVNPRFTSKKTQLTVIKFFIAKSLLRLKTYTDLPRPWTHSKNFELRTCTSSYGCIDSYQLNYRWKTILEAKPKISKSTPALLNDSWARDESSDSESEEPEAFMSYKDPLYCTKGINSNGKLKKIYVNLLKIYKTAASKRNFTRTHRQHTLRTWIKAYHFRKHGSNRIKKKMIPSTSSETQVPGSYNQNRKDLKKKKIALKSKKTKQLIKSLNAAGTKLHRRNVKKDLIALKQKYAGNKPAYLIKTLTYHELDRSEGILIKLLKAIDRKYTTAMKRLPPYLGRANSNIRTKTQEAFSKKKPTPGTRRGAPATVRKKRKKLAKRGGNWTNEAVKNAQLAYEARQRRVKNYLELVQGGIATLLFIPRLYAQFLSQKPGANENNIRRYFNEQINSSLDKITDPAYLKGSKMQQGLPSENLIKSLKAKNLPTTDKPPHEAPHEKGRNSKADHFVNLKCKSKIPARAQTGPNPYPTTTYAAVFWILHPCTKKNVYKRYKTKSTYLGYGGLTRTVKLQTRHNITNTYINDLEQVQPFQTADTTLRCSEASSKRENPTQAATTPTQTGFMQPKKRISCEGASKAYWRRTLYKAKELFSQKQLDLIEGLHTLHLLAQKQNLILQRIERNSAQNSIIRTHRAKDGLGNGMAAKKTKDTKSTKRSSNVKIAAPTDKNHQMWRQARPPLRPEDALNNDATGSSLLRVEPRYSDINVRSKSFGTDYDQCGNLIDGRGHLVLSQEELELFKEDYLLDWSDDCTSEEVDREKRLCGPTLDWIDLIDSFRSRFSFAVKTYPAHKYNPMSKGRTRLKQKYLPPVNDLLVNLHQGELASLAANEAEDLLCATSISRAFTVAQNRRRRLQYRNWMNKLPNQLQITNIRDSQSPHRLPQKRNDRIKKKKTKELQHQKHKLKKNKTPKTRQRYSTNKGIIRLIRQKGQASPGLWSLWNKFADKTRFATGYYIIKKKSFFKKRKIKVPKFSLKVLKPGKENKKTYFLLKQIYFRSRKRKNFKRLETGLANLISREINPKKRSRILISKAKHYASLTDATIKETLTSFIK